MKQREHVGASDFSRRKIYHPYVPEFPPQKGKVGKAICQRYWAFLDKEMTLREAKKKGYRLCLHCKRIMGRKK